MKPRLEHMDLLKCFAIFSVLVGHSTEQLSGGLFWDHPVWEFIYSYHMPLFMFVSGFFSRSSLRRSYGEMARRKFLQLGVPSLTAYAIACSIMLAAGVTAIADLCELSFNGFMNCVWFLKCLLFCYLLMHPICRWVRKDWVAALVATVLVILIPGTEIVNLNFMLPMFCLGMLCGGHMEEIERHRRLWLAVSIILFGVLLCFWSGHLTVYEHPTRFWSAGTAASCTPDWANLGLTIYRLALGMAGSMTFFLLSKPVYEAIRGWRWTGTLCRIGGATLGIYFLQTFLLEILVNRLQVYVPIPHSYWVAPLLAIAELAICYNLVLLIRKTRLLRLLILGEKP